jgi:ATP-dependent helicase/nuclease subunit B
VSGALRLYDIPSDQAFVDALAVGLLDRFGADPLALSRATVLLPTRRAARALRDALLRASGGRPLLLPAMRAIGDVDEDELAFDPLEGEDGLELPPAIPPLRRQLLLAALVRQWKERRGGRIDAAQAAQLAAELARLLDHLQTEGLALEALRGLAPERFASHWGETLAFLDVLQEPWRLVLEAEGAMDPAARRVRLIANLAARWRLRPPEHPVIAAGSTGSIPRTAELLGVVAALPRGAVVLPGLDRQMDDESWASLGPSHPQFGFRQLLDRLGAAREAVMPWPAATRGPRAPAARLRLIAEAMRPVETTPAWRSLPKLESGALDGLVRLDLPSGQDEATAIALLLREALETPGATAALVTPDRRLARRVAVELGRWKIAVDDSAGEPLGATAPGAFLRLAAEAFEEDLAPVPLLALLKHPLALGGGRAAFRRWTRRLDRRVLRGPRPAPGFAGLLAAARAIRPEDEGLVAWVERLAASGAAFAGWSRSRTRRWPSCSRRMSASPNGSPATTRGG